MVPDAEPLPPLLKVKLLGVLAVTVPELPRVMLVPLTVRLALAKRACASVPDEMLLALSAVSPAPDPLTLADVVMLPVTCKIPPI